MCGSFALPVELIEIVDYFNSAEISSGDIRIEVQNFQSDSSIRPTDSVPVLKTENGEQILEEQSWGFQPDFSSRPLINARAETVCEKPTFAAAADSRRCLIPAAAFYEWKQLKPGNKKTRFTISIADRKMFSLAGLYSPYSLNDERKNCFVVITRTARGELRKIHDRMPVILDSEDEKSWLNHSLSDEQIKTLLTKNRNRDLVIDPSPDSTEEQLSLF
ncbi:SOS response-associated peptidase [Halarsenatibacter silvermanii]|uniref:Abasic site processing protein n=1 Tax=Halarsenatibacter silvermanii TaxID=321763 RepID=A0A1G9SID1_9FIRM|nr:SOS response-associated peptidase [Halarsenatibacter silvermanii]SDM35070.1 Putative SOS response-associated peptidase YedK [Halarsenatibacter silvermanii]